MIRSCCHSLGFVHYLAPTFTTLGSLLESLLQAWDHFWSTLATFFEHKNDLRRQRCHQRCQREIFLVNTHLLGPHLGVFFADLLFFRMKSSCFFIVFSRLCFCVVFCVFFEQVRTVKTIKNTAQGSKNSECRKSKIIGPGPGLGWIWESFLGSSWRQMWFFVEKMSARKQAEKRYPRKVKQLQTVMSQGSLTAPLKSKIVWVINNNWTRSNNNKQQFNKNTNNCRVVASVRLLLCLFLVRFLLQTDVVSVSCSI